MGCEIVSQPGDVESTLQPGKPCNGDQYTGHKRDRWKSWGSDFRENRRDPFFHRGVYKIVKRFNDHWVQGEQILSGKRYAGGDHPLYDPGCDHGQGRLTARGCQRTDTNWFCYWEGVQPRIDKTGDEFIARGITITPVGFKGFGASLRKRNLSWIYLYLQTCSNPWGGLWFNFNQQKKEATWNDRSCHRRFVQAKYWWAMRIVGQTLYRKRES